MNKRYYVGLSATFHDPAIAVIGPDGDVRFAEAIERPMQDKRAFHSPPDHLLRTPELIKRHCEPGAELVGAVSFSETSLRFVEASATNDLLPSRGLGVKLSRFIDSRSFHDASSWPMPAWHTMRRALRGTLLTAGVALERSHQGAEPFELRRYNHHLTHAAYACLSSPFDEAVCAIIDGYGEFGSTGFFHFRNGQLTPLHRKRSPLRLERASLGLFYGLICGMCGFDSLKGEEWKVMGLAPYGKLDPELYALLRPLIKVQGLELVPGLPLDEEKRLLAQLHARSRPADRPPIEAADLAFTGQQLFADLMTELLGELRALGRSDNLVLGGGCALNSSYSGKIVEQTGFHALHVPSAPADDGNAIGAAWLAWMADRPGKRPPKQLLSPYLGSTISSETYDNVLRFASARHVRHLPGRVVGATARLLADGKIVGWMQGRAEFGPRALGHRSILADPRSPEMKDRINGRVKFREEYRPFAPSILHEHGADWFERYQHTPYMERTLTFRPEMRARVPAVVHEDGTGRLQSVSRELSPKYYELISAFYALTGVPIVLNTSFNIMGKPIIHSVEDAVGMFYTTGLDALVIDDLLIVKDEAALPAEA